MEQVLVDRVDTAHFRILATPGLVLGCAAGDVIAWDPTHLTIRVMTRGGNIAVHVYGDDRAGGSILGEMAALGGTLDGKAPGLTVYTVPVSAGFPAVERVLAGLVDRDPEVEWYFGNVYDPVDGITPLNWW